MAGKKIAILGGGLAGLSAAYEIASRQPDSEITVYQIGWRLGGKCASSRNQTVANRIQEHGIHILFGSYENAFHVLRGAYADIDEDWQRGFEEQDLFTLLEQVKGGWRRWPLGIGKSPGNPGDKLAQGDCSCGSVPEMAQDVIVWMLDYIRRHFAGSRLLRPFAIFFERSTKRASDAARCESAAPSPDDCQKVRKYLRRALFWFRIYALLARVGWNLLRFFLSAWLDNIDALRRLVIFLELGSATANGLLRAAADNKALTDFDDRDLIEWLHENAVLGSRISSTSVNAAPLRMIYEVIFAYEGGDPAKPNLAAGTALRGLLRLLFDYRGSFVYKMREGSSETMVTPLYSALLKKRVRFQFFHRVDRLELTGDKKNVAKVHFSIQALPATEPYDPLIHDRVHPKEPGDAWPDKPKYQDLKNGDALKGSNELPGGGFDLESPHSAAPVLQTKVAHWSQLAPGSPDAFDEVILAIPVAALPLICAELLVADPRWKTMCDRVGTVATQAAQLWLNRTAVEMGWDQTTPALVGAFAQPYGNWADMRNVLPQERWPLGKRPKQIAYLCGPLKDSDEIHRSPPSTRRDTVLETVRQWLNREGKALWDQAYDQAGEFRWDFLQDLGDAKGAGRLQAQYFRANTDPSERYVLSAKGSIAHRLKPDASGFANLYLAGDWTRNGFDVGCVEATMMSGRLAARSVLGLSPDEMPIYGAID